MHNVFGRQQTVTCQAAAASHELLTVPNGVKFRLDLLHANEQGNYGDLVADFRVVKGDQKVVLVASTDIDKATPLRFVDSLILESGWSIVLYTDAVTAGDIVETYITGEWLT